MSYCQDCADKQAALDAANTRVKELELKSRTLVNFGVVEQEKNEYLTAERDRLLTDKQSLREALEPFTLLRDMGLSELLLKISPTDCRNAARVLEETA